MKTRTRLLLASALGGTVIAGALLLRAPAPHATGAKGEPASAARNDDAPVARGASSILTARPQVGESRVYGVELAVDVRVGAAGADAAATATRRLRADWTTTCVAQAPGRIRYRAALEDTRVSSDGREVADASLRKDFARPFYFETDERGGITALSFDRTVGDDARALVKTLLAASQVVRGEEGAAAWTSLEQDPTGEYTAQYTREDGARVHKARVGYVRIATEQGLRDAAEAGKVTVNDDTTIDLRVGGGVDRIASTANTDIDVGQGLPSVHSNVRLSLAYRRAEDDASRLESFKGESNDQSPVAMAAAATPASQDQLDANLVKNATLADLEKGLSALPASATRERSAQIARLRGLFRLHPEDTKQVLPYVRTAAVNDGQAMTAALGGAATKAALAALADIARASDTPVPVRTNAIGAMAITPASSPASVAALKQLTSDPDPDVRSASTLALGAAAKKLLGSDPATYDDAVGMLLADLASAQSSQQKVLDLRALGNTGDPRVLAAAENAMSDPDPIVQRAAVSAVRFVPGADGFLARAMQSAADPEVRIQAIAVVQSYRDGNGYLAAFASILRDDSSALVRRAAVEALNVIRSSPDAIALIRAAAESDSSGDVRALAAAILAS